MSTKETQTSKLSVSETVKLVSFCKKHNQKHTTELEKTQLNQKKSINKSTKKKLNRKKNTTESQKKTQLNHKKSTTESRKKHN